PIGPDDPDALAAADLGGKVLPELEMIERLAQLAQLEHAISGALRGVERQVDLLLDADALDHVVAFEQAFEPGLSSLGLAAALAGTKAADELLLLGNVLLLKLVRPLLCQLVQLALLDVSR